MFTLALPAVRPVPKYAVEPLVGKLFVLCPFIDTLTLPGTLPLGRLGSENT